MNVKICGITNIKDALLAAEHGAWALGFNFYPYSTRSIPLERAQEIVSKLPKHVLSVGIFIKASAIQLIAALKLFDLVQVYEDVELPENMKRQMILSLQISSQDKIPPQKILEEYGYILLDAPKTKPYVYGGTGKLANWDLAQKLATQYRLILAGGLNVINIGPAIVKVKPFAVDVASGLELMPGIKNPHYLKNFLRKCHAQL